MMTTDKLGIYIHIPFCAAKCNYCNFSSFPCISKEKRQEYINALVREIYSYKRNVKIVVDTIFFGGGTPSYLESVEFLQIFEAIRDCFDLSELLEFTIEANPGTITEDKIKSYSKIGVNRISLGLQTIHENERKCLGRINNVNDFIESVRLCRKYGIENINADLMYGIPYQSLESFSESLSFISAHDIPHVSVYGLIIEEDTPFGKNRASLSLPDEDSEYDMYNKATDLLSSAGYTHYEISNYAKPGFESWHNLRYWKCREYIGVGLSAASYYENKRYVNTSDLDAYIENAWLFRENGEFIDRSNKISEYIMLSLRLKSGLSFCDYQKKFGESISLDSCPEIKIYRELGYLVIDDEGLRLTDKGFYISNTIISDILAYIEK